MEPNKLYEDIQAQGDNLRRVIQHLQGPERVRLKQAGDFLRNEKPIVFLGMGSATYLNYPAKFYLASHGRYADVLNASDAFYSMLPAMEKVNLVIHSRSGETVEIVKLAERLRELDIPFLALTNEPESRLAQLATHILWSNSRADNLVSINIVTGMMTTALLLAAEVLGHSEKIRPILDTLPTAMNESVVAAWQQAEELADLFEPVRPIYLLYRDASEGMGHCGRLVLEEVARWPAVAMEAGEFRQGAIEVMDPRLGAILNVPEGELGQLNLALAGDIQAAGGRVLLLGAMTAREVTTQMDVSDVHSHSENSPPLTSKRRLVTQADQDKGGLKREDCGGVNTDAPPPCRLRLQDPSSTEEGSPRRSGCQGPEQSENGNWRDFPIASVPFHFSPVLEIPPLQVLAFRLAERQGYIPGTVRYLSKVITTEVGIPKFVSAAE